MMKIHLVSWLCLATLLVFVHEGVCVNSWMPWNWGNKPRPVNGQWSSWSAWSSCQITTNPDSFPFRYKERNCSDPAPKNGGADCKGENRRSSRCEECSMPLGLESGRIEDSYITASHSHKEFPASAGRLNGKSAWCSMNPDSLEQALYLQIDLKKLTTISAIASQGFYPGAESLSVRMGRVSKYELEYSTNGLSWSLYKDNKNETILRGNAKRNGTVLNILTPEITARFIRVYPVSYFTFVCMRLELYGCTFACGEALSVEPGSIITKSSPTEDQDCLWHVNVPNITKLNMDFINFNLPCSNGFAELRNGDVPYSSATVLAHYCGFHNLPPLVSTSSGKLWVRFKSNASDPQVGFYSVYFPGCGSHIQGRRGEIKSPNFPKDYFHNSNCIWTITVPEGKSVRLNFVKFDVEGDANRQRCPHDHLSIWNGTNSLAPQIGKYCNSNPPPPTICSTGNSFRLKFHSDDALAYTGFFITFSEFDPVMPCFQMSPIVTPSSRLSGVITQLTPTPSITNETSLTQQAMLSTSKHLVGFATKTTVSQFTEIGVAPLKPFEASSVVAKNGTISFTGGSVNGDLQVAAQKKQKDGDDDDGLWSVIILSAFSFVVLCMIIASIVPSVKKHCDNKKLEKELSLLAVPILSIPETNNKETFEARPVSLQESSACEDEESVCSVEPADSESLSETPTAELIPEQTEADQIRAVTDKCGCGEEKKLEGEINDIDDSGEGKTETDAFIADGDDAHNDNNSAPEIGSLRMSFEDLGSSFAHEMQSMLGQFENGDKLATWNPQSLEDSERTAESLAKKESETGKNIPRADLPTQGNSKGSGCDCSSENLHSEGNHLSDTCETCV